MKIFLDFIFFYLLNFVIIVWIEKYFFYKISRGEVDEIILNEIISFKRNKYHNLLKIYLNIISLLLIYIFLNIFVSQTLTLNLSFIFLILFYIFYVKIRNSQIYFHQEIIRENEIILFSYIIFFCSLYALNYLPKNNSYGLKILIFLTSFPSLFFLNVNQTNKGQLHYITYKESIILKSFNRIFFTFINSFFIFYLTGKEIDFITLSILVFVFRIILYFINLVFVSFSKILTFFILSISFSIIILINILIKYVIR